MSDGLVYSTGHGRMCPDCGKPAVQCVCGRRDSSVPVRAGAVRVSRETKGRKGKGVSVISGLPLGQDALEELASRLKRRCGCGGTVRDGTIEIQGDQRDLLVAELGKLGYQAKRSGG
jgi:translation initiation factor 1